MVRIILLEEKLLTSLPKTYEIYNQEEEIKRYTLAKYTNNLRKARGFFTNALVELMKKEYINTIKEKNDKAYWTKSIIERSNIFFNVAVYNMQSEEEINNYQKNGFYLLPKTVNLNKLEEVLLTLEELEREKNNKEYKKYENSKIIEFKHKKS